MQGSVGAAGGTLSVLSGRGLLSILNVGAGDTTLSFDPEKPSEVAHAGRVVAEMLRLGFAILIQSGELDGEPLYRRARDFDPATSEYIVVGAPESSAAAPVTDRRQGKRRHHTTTRVKASVATAIAVGRTAGG